MSGLLNLTTSNINSNYLLNKQNLNSNTFINVKDYGAKGDGITDDTLPIQNAVNRGGFVIFPTGTYLISSPIVKSTPGLVLQGSGIQGSGSPITMGTTIKASSSFSGSGMFILGNKFSLGEVRSIQMKDIFIDVDGKCDAGVELYGLRDGSTFENVYITRIRKYGFLTSWTGSGDGNNGTMNQGLLFLNCHVIIPSTLITDGAYWELSGLYESTLINCKALGSSSLSTNTNTYGFKIGAMYVNGLGRWDCQGVRLYNCSSGNIIGTDCYAMWFGQCLNCSSDYHTMENCTFGIKFRRILDAGTTADIRGPVYCLINSPRFYQAGGITTVLNEWVSFEQSSIGCGILNVPDLISENVPPAPRIYFIDNCINCFVELLQGRDATTMNSLIDFTSTDNNNVVKVLVSNPATYTRNNVLSIGTNLRDSNASAVSGTIYYDPADGNTLKYIP